MRLRLGALVLGLALLAVSVVATARSGRTHARTELSQRLAAEASQQSRVLQDYFARARMVNLLTARNAAFAEFDGRHRGAVEGALGYVERLYPKRIAEVCFIDRDGRELARIVGDRAARPAELSPDESANAFFGPTLRLPSGQVFQAQPYISPDTRDWVISNSTMLPGRRGMVHFEISLDSFRREAARTAGGLRVRILDATGRLVMVDSRRPGRAGAPAGPLDDRISRRLGRAPHAGVFSLDGRFSAFRRVAHAAGNANDWYVLVSSPKVPETGWWRSFGVTNAAMTLAALLLLAFALTSFRAYQRTLRDAALCDELTGLPNRALFRDRLRQAMLQGRREHGMTAAILIDLDRFKEVNDTLGHQKGDLLLQQVGTRLRELLRESDTVARLGGDEFAVLVPRVRERGEVAEVAERIAAVMDDPFPLEGVAVQVDMSIGIALSPDDGDDADTLLQRADIAMYEAKRGRSGYAFYTSERDPYSARRLAMVSELRTAIESRSLAVHYQPKVDLVSGAIDGVEALVRWPHPEQGLISPGEFIPLAEQTGLIKPLTIAVLEEAVTQARTWADDGRDLSVAVNLSARNLVDQHLPGEVAGLLRRAGLAPDRLILEITESTIMSDPARALDVLTQLDAMGVRLSIDDFGTGYSSLAYLKRLPVDELKIDRGFVMTMVSDRADAFIVRCAIDLGRNLGLRVVAEGVEDEASLTALRELGCTAAQGFLFSRPVPAGELTRLLSAGGVDVPPVVRR